MRKLHRNKIELSEGHVVKHWTEKFGKSREEIEAAIEKVGGNPNTVKKELRSRAAKLRASRRAMRNRRSKVI
jgi:hypothetical protein